MKKLCSILIIAGSLHGSATCAAPRIPKLTMRLLAYGAALAARYFFDGHLSADVQKTIDVLGGSAIAVEGLSHLLSPNHEPAPKNQGIATAAVCLTTSTVLSGGQVTPLNVVASLGAGVLHVASKEGITGQILDTPVPFMN